MSLDKKRRQEEYIIWGCFAIGLFLYSAVTLYLFYHQAIGNETWFHSDIKAYIQTMLGEDSGYSFPYPLLFRLGGLFYLLGISSELAMALAITLLNSLTPIFLMNYFKKLLVDLLPDTRRKIVGTVLAGIVFALMFVSMLYTVGGVTLPGIYRRYLGVFSPNPYHNATYLATRPFSIVCFFSFGSIFYVKENTANWKDYGIFTLFLLLTTLTKPSFTFVMVPVAGLLMIARLIVTKCQGIRQFLILGVCFLPTFAVLLYQYAGVFAGTNSQGEEAGIGFGLTTAWQYSCENIPLALILGGLFPLVVLVFHLKDVWRDKYYSLSLAIWAMGIFQILFLYEKGFRLKDMNFSWGYMHGLFFAFVGATYILLKDTLSKKSKMWKMVLQWFIFLLHLVMGLLYFKSMCVGNLYY